MIAKENLIPLKMLVFSMGIVLIGGTVLLAGLLWKKAVDTMPAPSMANCANAQINLKGQGMIIESTMQNNVLRLTLQKKEGENEIVMVDTCSGHIINRLTIHSDDGMVEE